MVEWAYLAAIAILVAFAQTQDYNQQKEAEATARQDIYIEWHNEMVAATGDEENDRQIHVAGQ